MQKETITVETYASVAIPHLEKLVVKNKAVMERLAARLVADVEAGRSLLVFGSGHSAMFPMELYHRAGGASFVIPVFADFLLPTAGPPVVRLFERTPGAATAVLNRVEPKPGEMLWMASQSGINGAGVDLAIEAKKMGLFTVAFTSVVHSSAVKSRHPSGKRLFEVCDEVIDLGGFVGDAAIRISESVSAGPLSTLGTVLMGHSIVLAAAGQLERNGRSCIYTSVNTSEGESRNKELEKKAQVRDFLLR
ncbi:MAG TPA: sugar isomerase domain-containing protein [Bdellovibrionota bacterium]|nr:sugar isomerase domain-containing protein [Bdellovibrionota bacterium]